MNKHVQWIALCLPLLGVFLLIGEVYTKGICLYLSEKRATWIDALDHCQKNRMCLADIDTKMTLAQLTAQLEGGSEEYWFGLNSHNKNNYQYVSNDKPAAYVPEGSNLVHNGGCAFLRPHHNNFQFDSADCKKHKKFICTHTEMCEGMFGNLDANIHSCSISEEIRGIVAL